MVYGYMLQNWYLFCRAANRFLSFQNAVAAAAAAPYPGQYSGFEAYPYTTAAGATGRLFNGQSTNNGKPNAIAIPPPGAAAAAAQYMAAPYAYATLPQGAAAAAAAAGGFPGLSPYQNAAGAAAASALQEARLQ